MDGLLFIDTQRDSDSPTTSLAIAAPETRVSRVIVLVSGKMQAF